MTKTKIFIDFDGTLCDSKKLKRLIFEAIVDSGLAIKTVENEYKNQRDLEHFNPDHFLTLLEKKYLINRKHAKSGIEQSINQCADLIFPGAIDFLEKIPESFYKVLLTLGDPEYQREKAEISKIDQLFDSCQYITDEKWLAISKLIKPNEEFIIIDDRIDALQEVKKRFLGAITIGVNHYHKDFDNLSAIDLMARDFFEIINYLQKYAGTTGS